jgi:hypothetical protein
LSLKLIGGMTKRVLMALYYNSVIVGSYLK